MKKLLLMTSKIINTFRILIHKSKKKLKQEEDYS
jgi:hypothetical protein